MENAGMQDIADIIAEAMAAENGGNSQSTDTLWDRVTQGLGNDAQAMLRQARELGAQGSNAAADALLGHVVRIYPDDLIAALCWSEAAFKRGDWEETLRRTALVKQHFSAASFAYVLTAQALRESGRLEAADAAFGEAVERFPLDEGAAIQWADCAVRASNLGEANRRYAQARDRFPASPFSYSAGAQVLQADGRLSDADRLLTEAVDKFPNDERLHIAWIANARSREDWREAVSRAATCLGRIPEAIREILPMVNGLIKNGQAEAADALADRCASLFPKDHAVLTAWTEVALIAGKWNVAQLRAACLVERFPDDRAGYYFSATSLEKGGKAADAAVILEEGLRRFPEDLLLLRAASQGLEELDRPREAIAAIDKALALHPDDAYFLDRRIRLARDLGDLAGAMAAWRRLAANSAADRRLCSDLAWAIFQVLPADEIALELLHYLVNEPDSGHRDWLPRLADFAALNDARPDMKAFARATLPRIEADAHVPVTLHVLKSALQVGYTDNDILGFIRDYVVAGRTAITAYLFSRVYISGQPATAEACRRVFARYIERWLYTAKEEHLRNSDEILGYFAFSAIFSQSSYRRLVGVIAERVHLTAVQDGSGSPERARAVGRIASLASRVRPSNAKAEAISRIRRLKIAVCVSGELRGYERAFQSWWRLGLDRHDARYFVHGWSDAGFDWRRLLALAPDPEAITEILSCPDCATELTRRYPAMMAAWNDASTVMAERLQALYGTSSVIVEHDENVLSGGGAIALKVQGKIDAAYGLALASGMHFDLFISLRPDCEIMEGSNPDWNSVFHRSSYERVIYADRPLEYEYSGITIGYRFAAGCRDVMDIYTARPVSAMEFAGAGNDTLDLGANLACRTFHGGVLSSTVPDLEFGQTPDAGLLLLAELVPLIENDIAGRAADSFDNAFLAACRATVR
jgi:predicted Zn-dependent protease